VKVKQGIHPDYVESTVTCSCGNSFKTHSTKPELHVELCDQCHPFYTGQQKFVDTGGRVQRFSDKFGNAANAVLEKEAAEREARRKVADEAAAKAKQERDAKAAEKAEKAEKAERSERRTPKAEASAPAEEAPVEEAPVEEPAAEEAPVEEAPAEETGE
jgi:large subunit ribosomal protein L31